MTKFWKTIKFLSDNHIDWTQVTLFDIADKCGCTVQMASRAIIMQHGKPLEVLRRDAIKEKVKEFGKSIPSKEICHILGISKDHHYRLRREMGMVYRHGGDRKSERIKM